MSSAAEDTIVDLNGTEMTWLGHAAFRLRTGDGTTVLVDPWLSGNPSCPEAEQEQDRVDAIFITHGHFDHMADAEPLAKLHGATVFAIHEIAVYLEARGVDDVVGLNKGGTVSAPGGIEGTMVDAVHSGGMSGPDGIIPGGTPAGWVLAFPGGTRIYHAGDTMVFGDMRLIGELFSPDVALLPIGGHYVMDPAQAAYAAQLLGVSTVVPMHYGTFPILAGTPAQLSAALEDTAIEVADLEIGLPVR
jgi:L-ascorbate metabolism protein UlaG (beta-lactamase superfamily)